MPGIPFGLIADAGDQSDQTSEVSAVQFELADFLAGDHARKIRRLRFHLCDGRAFDNDIFTDLADVEGHIDARFLGHVHDNVLSRERLEALRGHGQVIVTRGQSARQIVAVAVRGGGARQADGGASDFDVGARDDGPGSVVDRASDGGSLLRECGKREAQKKEGRTQNGWKFIDEGVWQTRWKRKEAVSLHFATSREVSN